MNMRICSTAFGLVATLCCRSADAHLMPAQNATMNIVGNSAFMVVSVPVSALHGIDDGGNQRLSVAGIQRHNADIVSQFNARFHVESQGTPGTAVLTWVMDPQTDGAQIDMSYVVVMQRLDFAQEPRQPSVTTDLFGSSAGESTMTLMATRGAAAEAAVLSAGESTHVFFRGGLATFSHFLRVGVTHILGGFDHLLFLLTILVAAGWRYWLATITSFTVAHSISLALAVLGIVHLPAAFVEPAIAASIVLVALGNLWRRPQTTGIHPWRIAVVFACGLLHGVGFSSAVGAMPLDTGNRLATIAGFNLGIEAGQLLFIGAIIAIGLIATRLRRERIWKAMPRMASITAAAAGTALLLDRLYC